MCKSGKPVTTNQHHSSKYPESAQHTKEAQSNGHSDTVTIDRGGASRNRGESLKGIKPKRGHDRDKYPPAIAKEGGEGASVKYINPSDNRGSGACFGSQCKDVHNGEKVIIETK